MARKKKSMQKQQKAVVVVPDSGVKYKQITAEIFFTDGEIETINFNTPEDFLDYIAKTIRVQFVDSIRVELF